MRRTILDVLFVPAVLVALTACTMNPATGRSQLNAISSSREVAMGAESAPQFLQSYGGAVPSPQVCGYVDGIGRQLAAVSERKDLPWEFHIVDSQVINAFALPGGKVFITRGLASKLTNEAQLAGVLGHECGHVTAQHIGQQMTRAMGLQIVVAGLGMTGDQTNKSWLKTVGTGLQTGGSVYLLKFGRDQESEADALGMRYMSRIGYHPQAQLQVMQILANAAGAAGRDPEWLSTHPYPETRIQRITDLLQSTYSDAIHTPGKYRFAEAEYKQQMLTALAHLPPARHTGQEQARGDADAMREPGEPGEPIAWCWHCQQEARLARLELATLHE
ncbi:MAG: M48 family metalloprotease [Phycisphaeraceae bacterium]|nr:M48 family metalloprotease [Phycisphaeraceae bacterium]